MDVVLHVTSAEALPLAVPLAQALGRAGASWGCFLTNDGVRALADDAFRTALEGAARAAVCEHSWDLHMAGQDCPIERGSQTVNSAMMGQAARVVSL